MQEKSYVIGVDFGTDSVRSIIVNAADGVELACSVVEYSRWKNQYYCNASFNQFRQHPLDYIEGMELSIKNCISTAGNKVTSLLKGISIDTTGSTPVAVDKFGVPLALLPQFADNPNAMFVLWKDHTSIAESDEINLHAQKFETNYLQYVGGIYSSEWFWAKLLHILRTDKEIQKACASWVEHCDWIPFLLTGGKMAKEIKRSVCAAGHKSLWSKDWGGLPPNNFFSTLDPLLDGFTEKLFSTVYTADKAAGTISHKWAKRLGLPENLVIGIGAFDCHMGAVGGQIEPYYLSKVMGTSTCDMLVAPGSEVGQKLIKGICGQVEGSIIPGMVGMEAGQSAFGDAYAWFKNLLAWPLEELVSKSTLSTETLQKIIRETEEQILPILSQLAAQIPLEENAELSLDWLNGRRTPDANQSLRGAFHNLNLASTAPALFKSLVESTCFGAKAIVERFVSQGIPVKGIIGLGGIALKSPFIMQMMADVLDMPIKIHKSEQTCALGAAMFAATAAGIYTKVEIAMDCMGPGFGKEYFPDKNKSLVYGRRYEKYKFLGHFAEFELPLKLQTKQINKGN
ncbi:MAG: ribulokinase [Flavisolibacter sp.]